MDFTSELSAFQGVLLSADNVHSFSRLTARGGNEDQIDYIVEKLLRFLHEQNYLSQNDLVEETMQKMRKFAFYVILNADLPSLETLVENDGVDSVIWTIPTIPQCLMGEMLWKLHMDKFVYEAVAFSCPQLSFDVSSALVTNMKYFTPLDSLEKLQTIATALYKQICRLDFFVYEDKTLNYFLPLALNIFQKCLNYFIEPPKAYQLVNLKKDALYKFKGNSLETMFLIILECLKQFTSVQVFSPGNCTEIYQLTYKVGGYKEDPLNYATCNSPNKSLLECLDKFNEILLDVCKVLVMDISVDIFCAWSEFDVDGQSMQQIIGELCYVLRTKLLNTNILCEHPVVNMLQQISRKPVELQDVIDDANTETIVKNIQNNDKNLSEWVRALIAQENLCRDNNLIEIVISNLHTLNEDEHFNLFTKTKTYLDSHLENTERVKVLAVRAFQKCSTDQKNEILNEHFKNKSFTDSLETTDFNDMLTETFNKVISEVDADLTGILTVFLQNPQRVYTKIFDLSAESNQATDIMLKAMTLLEKYSNHYYTQDTEPCITRIAETVLENYLEKEVTQQNFIKFICHLKTANIITGTKLLLLIVMPKLHKALLDKDVSRIHFQCKLLSKAFSIEELLPYRAPMLAMIAQVLDILRWKITTFVEEGPSALQLALEFQQKMIDTYDDKVTEKEDSWLKTKLRNLHILNCYYYRKLWNPPGRNFVEITSGYTIQPDMDQEEHEEVQSWLSETLPSVTLQEFCEIWDALAAASNENTLTSVIFKLLTILTVAEKYHRTASNSWQCILYCFRNLVYIIRYKYFKKPLTDQQVTTVIQNISSTANYIDEDANEAIYTVFLPLFVYIASRKDDYTVDVNSLLNKHLKNETFKMAVSKIFSNSPTDTDT